MRVISDKKKSRRALISNLFFIVFVGIVLIFLINGEYFNIIYKTKIYARLTGSNRATVVSDSGRWNMYVKGFKKFWEKPFFGVGFNYVKYTFVYTHSTFMELLIGTGMFGFFIYFIPFFNCIKKYIAGLIKGRDRNEKKYYAEKTLIGIVLIVMMATRSIVYYVFPMAIWALFICDYNYADREEKLSGEKADTDKNVMLRRGL